jgi:phenylpyruvate tautomerase PptA (4-oxalocrotonate tautomerase family)
VPSHDHAISFQLTGSPQKTSHDHVIPDEEQGRTMQRMPMIDVYTAGGTFGGECRLAQELAAALIRWEALPEIPLFADNTVAFIRELPAGATSNITGWGDNARVNVLACLRGLDRDKQPGVVKELTEIVARAAGVAAVPPRTWVEVTGSPEGGWGIAGRCHSQAHIAAAPRAALSDGD